MLEWLRKGKAVPIPAFDNILNVLPPHLGDPRDPTELSPYPCSMQELCSRFAKSAKRTEILRGLLHLRKEMFDVGIAGTIELTDSDDDAAALATLGVKS